MRNGFRYFVVLTLLLSACSRVFSPNASETVTSRESEGQSPITVWVSWNEDLHLLENLFQEFSEQYKIPIDLKIMSINEIEDSLSARNAADLLLLNRSDRITAWKNQNYLRTVDRLINQTTIETNDFYYLPLAQCAVSGRLYCLPLAADVEILFWNKEVFLQYGLDPEQPPVTMEELQQVSTRLDKIGEGGKIYRIGFLPNYPWDHTDFYVHTFGGTLLDPQGKINFASPQILSTFEWQQEFFTPYRSDELIKLQQRESNILVEAFATGQVGMMLAPQWMARPGYLEADFDFGIAPFPYPETMPERQYATTLSALVIALPSASQNTDAAIQLAGWLLSESQIQRFIVASQHLPVTRASAEEESLQSFNDFPMLMQLSLGLNTTGVSQPADPPVVERAIQMLNDRVLINGESSQLVLEQMGSRYSPEPLVTPLSTTTISE